MHIVTSGGIATIRDELVDYILQEGLKLHNKGKEYTYEWSTGKSIIDLTLAWNLRTGLKSWKVHIERIYSEHIAIKYTLETEMEVIPVHRPWNKADWLTFKAELENKKIYMGQIK